jgi:hypothetical protein
MTHKLANSMKMWRGNGNNTALYKGTTDAIGIMRIISESVLDFKEEICLCFIDWEKAFDRVYWTKLLEMPRNIGVCWKEYQLIHNGTKSKITYII